MDVRRYFAPTAREALRALKEELGGEAIVLSNRAAVGGVEILALPPGAIDTVHAPKPAPAAAAAPVRSRAPRLDDRYGDDFHVTLSSLAAEAVPRRLAAHAPRREEAGAPAPHRPAIRPFSPPRIDVAAGREVEKAAERLSVTPATSAGNDERVRVLSETNARLMDELAGIRGVIERGLSNVAWNETRRDAPARADALGELLAAGFSAEVARALAKAVEKTATPAAAREAAGVALGRRLSVRAPDAEIIDGGGVFALVGPTGAGKTTTVAKIAARFVTRHGAGNLALITTDGYRIGAQEQLRIYGRILGVPVFAVRDGDELRQTLQALRGKRLVLIDTVGMSQRDRMVDAQATMLAGAGEVRHLLLLNATCRGDTLDDVARAFGGPSLAGGILTKVDEAASIAPALDVAVRRELELCYVTNGQRVPEDLLLPERAWLWRQALPERARALPWRLDSMDTGALLAAAGV
ncbi:MAG: flagellar biosynthesis protein FlhF [Azoarcus sp.]|jgi:flagellar biosynthesis protein FlhF|nr:flagellar biosynthesis protein FlhF [Azoarcus sp.]